MSKAILKEYISYLLVESKGRIIPRYISKSIPFEDRHELYNKIVDFVIDLSNKRNSIDQVYLKVLENFSQTEGFISDKFNKRTVQNIKAKHKDQITTNLSRQKNIKSIPLYISRSIPFEERESLYNKIYDFVIDLSNKRNSIEQVYLKVLENFSQTEGFVSDRFTKRTVQNIKAKHKDQITTNLLKNKNKKLPLYISRSIPIEDRQELDSKIIDFVINLSNERNSIDQVYLKVLENFSQTEGFVSDRFTKRTVQNIKAKHKDQITIDLRK